MFLNQTAEYALRAMGHLGLLPPGTTVRAQDVSQATGIPPHYVSKVLRRMVAAGLLVSQKGHGGGFRLSRPAVQIRFLDVLGAVLDDLQPGRCAYGRPACDPNAPCPLHDALAELELAVMGWAARTNLGSVGKPLRPARPLRQAP